MSTGNLTRQANWYDLTNVWHNYYYTYNSYGLPATAKSPRNSTTTYSYDSYYLYPATVTNPKGYTVNMDYDYATGQVTSRTDENGITSETEYDGFGRITEVLLPNPTTGTLTTLSTTTYDDSSTPASITMSSTVDGVSSESVTYFDGFGRTVQMNTLAEDGVYTTVDTWYDELGNISEQSLPYETSSSAFGRDDSQYGVTNAYDALNRPITVTFPTGSTTYDYSQWENTVTNANGIDKVYNYDAAGHLLSVEEQNEGASYTSTYDYDPLGELITLTDAQGNIRNFDYDSLGRKISQSDLHDPSESSPGTWAYTYDKNNNLITQTDPSGQVITWAYDALDRVSYEDWDTSTTTRNVVYTYDTATRGKMRLYQAKVGASEYIHRVNSYDALGNATSEQDWYKKPSGSGYFYYTFTSTYDLLARLKELGYPSAASLTLDYSYNAGGALESIDSTRGTLVSDMDYSPLGQITRITYGNGVVTENTFDPAESYRLTAKTTTGIYSDGSTPISGAIQDLTYSYDNNGNITSVLDASITPTAKTITYTYDDLNRLTSASTSVLTAGDYTQTYGYDEVGNLVCKSDLSTVDCLAGDENLSYEGTGSQSGSYSGANPHAVTSVLDSSGTSTSYLYDSNGNLTSNTAHSYSWDARNRLSSSGSKSFYYGPTGSRYKTLDTSSGSPVYTYYTPLMERHDGTSTSHGTPTYYIMAGGQRIASLKSNVYTFYHQDHLGGTALATDSTGTVVQVYDYYPYGSELLDSQPTGASVPSEHSFTDKELDDDLGLYYFEARWYDSEIGRFASPDPLDGMSYTYANNNPLIFIDPTGLYNVETGEIEDGDTQETITSSLSEALGIDVIWDDVVETGFWNGKSGKDSDFSFEDSGIENMVGWHTLADANTKDISNALNTLNEVTSSFLDGSSLSEFYSYFREGGPGDLKVSNYTLFGEGPNGRENWAYIYHDKLVRYDAPGSIHVGAVANSLGFSLTSVFFGSNVVNFPSDDRYDRSMQAHGYYQTWNNYTSIWKNGW